MPRDTSAATVAAAAASSSDEAPEQQQEQSEGEEVTFESLGVCPELCDAISKLGWTTPTPIQREAIPQALAGRDVIGLAQTGSGSAHLFPL